MTWNERRVSFGPVQEDKSILVATYDPEEVHDILVNPDGTLRSENIWGGKYHHRCECGSYLGFTTISKYVSECYDCKKLAYDDHHCLIFDHEENEVYVQNRGISFFHWKLVQDEPDYDPDIDWGGGGDCL